MLYQLVTVSVIASLAGSVLAAPFPSSEGLSLRSLEPRNSVARAADPVDARGVVADSDKGKKGKKDKKADAKKADAKKKADKKKDKKDKKKDKKKKDKAADAASSTSTPARRSLDDLE